MENGDDVIFNEKVYEIIHIYDTGFMEIKEKGNENLNPILLVSQSEIEVCRNKQS